MSGLLAHSKRRHDDEERDIGDPAEPERDVRRARTAGGSMQAYASPGTMQEEGAADDPNTTSASKNPSDQG
jgi:hypothetical protein